MTRDAVIVAAGRGARLDRPGTPKPLVDVAGEPMLFRVIRQLHNAGIQRAVVVVGYRGGQIARALRASGDFGLQLEIVKNPDWRKGLASSVVCARKYVSGPFVLSMSDHVFDDCLVQRLVPQDPPPDGVTVLVDPRLDRHELGSAVAVRRDGEWIVEIGRNLTGADAVDAGLFVATPSIFEVLQRTMRGGSSELCDGIRVLARQQKALMLSTGEGCWDDVDSPADLVRAERRLRAQKRTSSVSARSTSSFLENASHFDFVMAKPAVTRVLVSRGLVENPERVGLIPAESASSPVFVFTDETVNRLYGQAFIEKLRSQGYDAQAIVLPDGEESKTLSNYVYLVERVLRRGVDERSVFISLGGGIVCNVCGFVASTIYRGLDLVHVPTTLMAQCDAAISHKQGINGQRGKNMIGTYFPPRLVAIDVNVLATLSKRQVRDGFAEVIKHALAQAPDYVEFLLSYTGDPADPDFLEEIVRRNVELKRLLVQTDPTEQREAVVLQYGHTFGHPIEHLSGYRLFHGESVAIGMMIAAHVARLLGACRRELVELHEELLVRFGLPIKVPADIRARDVMDALRFNKRHLTEGARMALLAAVGRLWCVDGQYMVPVSDVVLSKAFEANGMEKSSWLGGLPSLPAREPA